MNIYRLRATCLCPANDGRDHYDVEVRSETMIRVERLTEFFNARANERIYQEQLRDAARAEFGAEVRLMGQHPTPVTVESS